MKKVIEPCCDAWSKAHESGTDNEMYGALARAIDGEARMGADLPPVRYCPWCGAPKNADAAPANSSGA